MTAPTSILGLTQPELAKILGVSRPLITLFELGKRSLPLPAKTLLTTLLTHMQSPTLQAKANQHQKDSHEVLVPHLNKRLEHNHFEQIRIQTLVTRLEKKIDAHQRRLHLNEYLAQRTLDPADKQTPPITKVKLKPAKEHEASYAVQLLELELKLELLHHEQSLLTKRLQAGNDIELDAK